MDDSIFESIETTTGNSNSKQASLLLDQRKLSHVVKKKSPPAAAAPAAEEDTKPKATASCVLDRELVNENTLHLLDDIGLSIFATACSKNRGAFVLDPPDGHTYGCLALPDKELLVEELDLNIINSSGDCRGKKDTNSTLPTTLNNSGNSHCDFNLTKVEDITQNFDNGNLTATDTVKLLNFLVQRVYASTPDVETSPYACDVNGLVTLDHCPYKKNKSSSNSNRNLSTHSSEKADANNIPSTKSSSSTTTSSSSSSSGTSTTTKSTSYGHSFPTTPIRAATVAGVFSPAPWAVQNSSTPSGMTLTQRDAEFYYVSSDFSNMSTLGLNAVQFPVAVKLFEQPPGETQAEGPRAWLNLLTKWIGFTFQHHMQAIVKLEFVPPKSSNNNDASLMEAVAKAVSFLDDINRKEQSGGNAVMAITLPSTDPAVIQAAARVGTDIPLWLPVGLGDLVRLDEIMQAVPEDVPISAISLDLSHTSTVADVASSTAEEDRAKLVYHETMACLQRAPLEYAQCYHGLPVFVGSGFDIAIDDCHMKRVLGNAAFRDYGQCGRLEDTIYSRWWGRHRRSFAARQISAYEKGGLGWSYATWKVFRVGKEKTGIIDKPAKLLSLKDVHANGWFPNLNKESGHSWPLALSCLNPPENDFVLGDATLAPTMGPPPDCGNGWWNYTTEKCDYWVPPPFNASECPNTTIIYKECPEDNENDSSEISVEDLLPEHTLKPSSSTHHNNSPTASLLQGFFGGTIVAFGIAAAIYYKWGRNRRSLYQYVPPSSGSVGYQEYQHHSQNSLRAAADAAEREPLTKPLSSQQRKIF